MIDLVHTPPLATLAFLIVFVATVALVAVLVRPDRERL